MRLLKAAFSFARCYLILPILMLVGVSPIEAAGPDLARYLTPEPVQIEKSTPVLEPIARTFLADRDGDTSVVWVFFTDKGISGKQQFAQRASAVSIPDKAMRRRAKTASDRVLYIDLPVNRAYVDAVIAAGAQLRRTTKWLNAMSAEVPLDRLDEIAALPFVAEIRPLARYHSETVELSNLRPDPSTEAAAPADVLNYGSSLNALNMIGVPTAHQLGYRGEGVTICIMDTGFRKTHEAFANHIANGRFLAEYDFVFNDGETANEPEDWSSQWNHGTLIWGVVGGEKDGTLYGPAFKSNFLLAKTEDLRSETPVEEDNWIAALEWADSLGADVTTTSLTYSDWYTIDDYDGLTAPITLAANTAAALGIVACNAMGNAGPAATTLGAPADAFDILSVGAVDAAERLAGFSSRGPTSDGRTKPEVCAQGVGTWAPYSNTDNAYGTANGTSLSTPLVAGAAALMVQARPSWPPALIRQALMESASQADSPDNNFGWGIVSVERALQWGAEFSVDTALGYGSLAVQFTNQSQLPYTSLSWDFGDGGSSTDANPTHLFNSPGAYDVSLTIETEYGPVTNTQQRLVIVLGDTLTFVSDSSFAGSDLILSVELNNSQPLQTIQVPFTWEAEPRFTFDSVRLGDRTVGGATLSVPLLDRTTRLVVSQLQYMSGQTLPQGNGEILKLYYSTPAYVDGYSAWIDSTTYNQYFTHTIAPYLDYGPVVVAGEMSVITVSRGDMNYDSEVDPVDLSYFVDYLFSQGLAPVSTKASDVNRDFKTDGADLSYLVDFFFSGGPPPPQ